MDFSTRRGMLARKKRSRPLWPFLVLLVLIGTTFLVRARAAEKQKPTDTTQGATITEALRPTVEQKQALSKDLLMTQLKTIFEGKVGTYSIFIYDLNTNEGFGISEDTVLTAASVNKVPILAGLYHLADTGDIDLDDTVTIREKDIQDYGTGIIRYQKPGVQYSIKTLARLMMQKSDNTAAYVLARVLITAPKLQSLMDEWELVQTDIDKNKTSAHDMAILMTKMYRGEIANEALTREMLGFMTDSDFEDRIPALLPPDTIIYHKTGDEIGNMHDVGIVEIPNQPYFVAFLALDFIDGEDNAKQAIATASKLIYDYRTQGK